jgi:hypothetical protein
MPHNGYTAIKGDQPNYYRASPVTFIFQVVTVRINTQSSRFFKLPKCFISLAFVFIYLLLSFQKNVPQQAPMEGREQGESESSKINSQIILIWLHVFVRTSWWRWRAEGNVFGFGWELSCVCVIVELVYSENIRDIQANSGPT